jgi:protoporphyrinogen oxidase
MAAIGASYRLRQEAIPHVAYDKKWHAGGHTSSSRDEHGFVFDEGPHISFTKNERIKGLLAEAVRGDFLTFSAKVNNLWRGHWIKHPAQCNLHGLPTDLVVKIIEDMLVASYGRTFAEHFPMQYGKKYHTVEARLMSLDWLGKRLYQPSMTEVLTGALAESTPDVHYISDFRYPANGGFQAYLKPFHQKMKLQLGHRLVRIDIRRNRLTFANGTVVPYSRLISSLPLPALIATIPDAPPEVRAAADKLACSICLVVNVGLSRPDISESHWTYFYDDDFCFSRISFPHMFSPNNAPPGMGSIQCEIYFSDKYKPVTGTPTEWRDRAIADLCRAGLIRADDRIVSSSVVRVNYANVIFDLDRAGALKVVRGYLDELGIESCGRYGEWGYQWTDESFISGERAAQRVLDRSLVRV